jgi:hypothetical protein
MSTARVDFTRGAAERIAATVRRVEQGDRDGAPLTFRRVDVQSSRSVRFCTWTAGWNYSQQTTVSFDGSTASTAQATNLVIGVGAGQGWVAKRGTNGYYLVMFDMTQAPGGYEESEIQLFGHNSSGGAVWYNITSCTATSSP